MNRSRLAFCLILFGSLPVMAVQPNDARLDVGAPAQPPPVTVGNGTDALPVMKVVGGKGGNSTDTSGL